MKPYLVILLILTFCALALTETGSPKPMIGCVLLAAANGVLFL